MRVYHLPRAEPCSCGVPNDKHPTREQLEKRKAYDAARPKRFRPETKKQRKTRKERDAKRPNRQSARKIVGVDGEGHDLPDGRHIYTFLSAVDEFGDVVSEAYNPSGLTHDECAEMLLAIPRNTLKFWFMGGYDITKICQEMHDIDKFYLFRPELRMVKTCNACETKWKTSRKSCPKCEGESFKSYRTSWRYKGRGYDYFNGNFTVRSGYVKKKKAWSRSSKVWDSFRFFGKSFVEALKDWKIGTPEQVERILAMKNQRGDFESVDPETIKKYCREECELLAKMMRKVIQAHKDAGLELERYEGAGSSASAMLKKFGLKKHIGPSMQDLPLAMTKAVMAAFFGGRFECSSIGTFPKEVYGYDISSAYPYAMVHLPCLACGKWRLFRANQTATLKAMKHADLALCKFRVKAVSEKERRAMAWAPLPFRDSNGSICYPTNFEGWAWKPELQSAFAGWPGLVETLGETWLYSTSCDHKPFAFLPELYRERNRLGKDGAGTAIKLAMNAAYGKTAQSKGDKPPYQSWIYAGMTTATTRAQLNDAICSAKDRWNVLALATDSATALEEMKLARPVDTGTFAMVNDRGEKIDKPLGGWEEKIAPHGAFFAKPGVYFALDAELKDIRARGVGRRELHAHMDKIVSGFAKWDRKNPDYRVRVWGRRFFGAKHCVMSFSRCEPCNKTWNGVPDQLCPKCGEIGSGFRTLQQRFAHCKDCKTKLKSPKIRKKLLKEALLYGYDIDLTESLCGACAKPKYGNWGKVPTDIAFDPNPKRERQIRGSRKASYARLTVRDAGGKMSVIYKAGKTTPEGLQARKGQEFSFEQPDWPLSDETI